MKENFKVRIFLLGNRVVPEVDSTLFYERENKGNFYSFLRNITELYWTSIFPEVLIIRVINYNSDLET